MGRYQVKNEGKTPRFLVERGVLLEPGKEVSLDRVDAGTWNIADLKITDLKAPPVPVEETPKPVVRMEPAPIPVPVPMPKPVTLELPEEKSVEVPPPPVEVEKPKSPGRRHR